MPERQDNTGADWVVLYEHQAATERYPEEQGGEHSFRQKEFRFLMSFFVQKGEVDEIVSILKSKEKIDLLSWEPPHKTDESFLYESTWRTIWLDSKWRFDNRDVPEGTWMAYPVWQYNWESHLDSSLPNGFNIHLPAPWLAKELKLTTRLNQIGC